ncbi:relaxase/mobilization nuclease domain-containing protein [Cryobacterium sp. TMT1-2-2]|uniref:relaxase/mobilization nuclease domain-containing protein n=1 Tax=Cryobacterium sp. TMT1-2-2 TaxID=1259233 RepID=UPI00141ADDDA|nr:relaxase/mobilization nuclease domain-containing protein [Cryobacterium sp. TMT1-2-2]
MIGKTAIAARLLRYTEKEKAGGTEPRVLYSEGIRCRVPTAEREFAAVRRVHGKQGAKRKVSAKYELPEPGEVATHVRRARPNGRKYWAVAAGSTAATHVRREGDGYVDEIQAVHVIVSFGLDEVNPDDPEQVRRAFEFVTTMMTGLYPGVQMKCVGQADGLGAATLDGSPGRALFHVHVVQNAVVVERMEIDGQVWEAGRKMSGALTDIRRLRERADEFIAQRGAEYGVEQKLPSVAEQRAEKRSTRDRRMAAKGAISNHDIIRAAFEDSMDDPRSADLDGFVEVMSEYEVTVNHRVSRAGKPDEKHALSYRLDDMKTPVRGTTLGDHYAFDSTLQQLNAKSSGQQRERRPEQQRVGAPKPLSVPTTQELADAQAVVARLAHDEHMTQTEERAAQIEKEADNDLLDAMIEDLDAAIHARDFGDFRELARLANTTLEKEARRKSQRTTAASSPKATVQDHHVRAPEPRQPAPATKPAQQKSSIEERRTAALDEGHEQADAKTQGEVPDYMLSKASDVGTQTDEAPAPLEQSATLPVPDGVSLSALREIQEARAATQMTPVATSEQELAERITNTPTAEEATEKLRKINERIRHLGLPSVSPEQHAANQAMTPEQRKWRMAYPELFEDTTPGANPSRERNGLTD